MAWAKRVASNYTDCLSQIISFATKELAAESVTPGSNTGDGSLYGVSASERGVVETWTIECTVAGGSEVAQFSVVGSVSGTKDVATCDVPYSIDEISFIILSGTTDFIVGDSFTFDVVAISPEWSSNASSGYGNMGVTADGDFSVTYTDFVTTDSGETGDWYNSKSLGGANVSGAPVGDYSLSLNSDGTLSLAHGFYSGTSTRYVDSSVVINDGLPHDISFGISGGVPFVTADGNTVTDTVTADIGVLQQDMYILGFSDNGALRQSSLMDATFTQVQRVDSAGTTTLTEVDQIVSSLLVGTGTGTDEIFVGFRTITDGSTYFNVEVSAMSGYIASNSYDDQPGIYSYYSCLSNVSFPFWIFTSSRRIMVIPVIGTLYEALYAGWFLPNATASQYAYPIFVGGSTDDENQLIGGTEDDHTCFWAGYSVEYSGAVNDGTSWVGINDFIPKDYGRFYSLFSDIAGNRVLYPCEILRESSTTIYGRLEGIYFVGNGDSAITANDVLNDGSKGYIVTQDVFRTGTTNIAAIDLMGDV